MAVAFAAAISIVILGLVCRSQPISLKDLASRVQISEQSTPDELVSAAVAWSLADLPTEQVCPYVQRAAPSYAILRAATSARCANIKIDVPEPPKHPKDLYDAVLTKPESSQLKSLLSMVNDALQHEKFLLLHAGSYLISKIPHLQNTAESKQIVALFSKLLKSSSKDLLQLDDESMSHLQKANHLGSSAYYLGNVDLVKPEPGVIQRLAEMIVSESYARSTEDIAAIIELATHISRFSNYSPVICDTVKNKDGLLSLKVTDLFGRTVQPESVKVVSCKSSQGSSLTPIHQSVSDNVYNVKFDLKSKDASPGLYHPIIEITSLGRSIMYDSPKMTLTAYGTVELSQFKAWTSSKHEDSINSVTATFPNESKGTLEIASPSTHLHINFQLNTNLDDVAYIGVALINVDTNKHVILTPTKKNDGMYKVRLKYTHSTFNRRVPGNGRYQIKLLVSDPEIPDFIAWTVCDATVNLAKQPGAVRLVSDFAHMSKPIIEHHRTSVPPKTSRIVWIPFTVLMAIPLFWLLFAWSRQQLNLAIDARPASVAFLSLLLGCVLTLISYWVGSINLTQLLHPMAAMSLLTAISYRAFRRQALQNEK